MYFPISGYVAVSSDTKIGQLYTYKDEDFYPISVENSSKTIKDMLIKFLRRGIDVAIFRCGNSTCRETINYNFLHLETKINSFLSYLLSENYGQRNFYISYISMGDRIGKKKELINRLSSGLLIVNGSFIISSSNLINMKYSVLPRIEHDFNTEKPELERDVINSLINNCNYVFSKSDFPYGDSVLTAFSFYEPNVIPGGIIRMGLVDYLVTEGVNRFYSKFMRFISEYNIDLEKVLRGKQIRISHSSSEHFIKG